MTQNDHQTEKRMTHYVGGETVFFSSEVLDGQASCVRPPIINSVMQNYWEGIFHKDNHFTQSLQHL